MKTRFAALALAVASFCAPLAHADAAPAKPALYHALGEMPGLVRLVDDFMPRLVADPRTGPFFQPANQPHIKAQLVDQFCMVSGGPCTYQGVDMANAHANLDIRKSDFHALVELLQQAMDAQGIPFGAQNQLLARLAPMHRDVITLK